MDEQFACVHCHTPLYPPPAVREYACPRCGRRLPRRGGAFTSWVDRIVRGSLAAGCLATIVAVGWHLVLMPKASTDQLPGGLRAAALRQPYEPREEARYRLRSRQLEADLRRDPREYGLIVKLAVLYTRLGIREQDPARRAADLERAKALYELAMQEGVAMGRRDFEFAAFQLERLAGRYPVDDVLTDQMPTSDPLTSVSPFILDREQMLHMRLEGTRFRLATLPNNARLLCRLGWTYFRLAETISQRDTASPESFYYASARMKPEALMDEAIQALQKTVRVSRSQEYRVEAYQGLALIYQAQGRWHDALAMLQKITTLQPNNWPANHRIASVLRRLGREADVGKALARGDSWRTSEWL